MNPSINQHYVVSNKIYHKARSLDTLNTSHWEHGQSLQRTEKEIKKLPSHTASGPMVHTLFPVSMNQSYTTDPMDRRSDKKIITIMLISI